MHLQPDPKIAEMASRPHAYPSTRIMKTTELAIGDALEVVTVPLEDPVGPEADIDVIVGIGTLSVQDGTAESETRIAAGAMTPEIATTSIRMTDVAVLGTEMTGERAIVPVLGAVSVRIEQRKNAPVAVTEYVLQAPLSELPPWSNGN